MVRIVISLALLILVSACTAKPGVRVGAEGTNKDAAGQILFSQPF